MNKKKIGIISGIALLLGISYGFIYHKTHTNKPNDIKDYTGKYILNPDYYKFKEVEWTDLKTVYPTKLAYDPSWFKLPPEKYIPKEQPIPKNISNISDPIIRRQAYFNFLCKTEYAAYMTNDIKDKRLGVTPYNQEGLLDLTIPYLFSNTKNLLNNKNIYLEANSNPFIFPIYNKGTLNLQEGKVYDFLFHELSNEKNDFSINHGWGKENQFLEFMSPEGFFYKIEYDSINDKFLPLKIYKNSNARFYILKKFSDKESLKNLGISSFEQIIYDRKEKKLVFYIKQFNIGAFLPWTVDGAISNFSWIKQSGCQFKPQYIDKF